MLQTNNTGVCAQCLSHTGSAPAHSMCSLPAHTAQALGCSARNNERPALGWPPRSKPLRFRHSGSPQRCRLGWACVMCSSQIRAAQMMRCLAGANAATYRLPATRLSGCKTGAPSQAAPFEELGCFSGCLMSSAGIQKLFCGIYSTFKCSFDEFEGEKVFSPSYSSAILAPPYFWVH